MGVVEMGSIARGEGTANSMSQGLALKASADWGDMGSDCARKTPV